MPRSLHARCLPLLTALLMAAVAASSTRLGVCEEPSSPVNGMTPVAFHADSNTAALDALRHDLDRLQRQVAALICASDCCCAECATGGFTAGFAFYFARPTMKESFQATRLDFGTGVFHLAPVDYDYALSPRVWIGYESAEGPGVRARYWQFDQAADPFVGVTTPTEIFGANAATVIFTAAISTAAPGDTLTVFNSLEVHTLDLEGTIPLELGGIDITGSAGVRYAKMRQQVSAISDSLVTPGTLDWERQLEGLGLTLGAEADMPLGTSGFSAFGEGRGSLIVGEQLLRRSVTGDVTPVAAQGPANIELRDAAEVSAIFELSLGLQYARSAGRLGDVFVRGAYETQLWTAAGQPTLTYLGFDGFNLSLGLTR